MAIFIAEKSMPANSSSREGTEREGDGTDDCRLIQGVYSSDDQQKVEEDH